MDEEADEDEDALDPAIGRLDDHAGDNAEDGEDTHENDDAIVQGILQRVDEGGSLCAGLAVFAVPIRSQKARLGPCEQRSTISRSMLEIGLRWALERGKDFQFQQAAQKGCVSPEKKTYNYLLT